MSGGDHPVVLDEGTTAKPSAVNVDGHLPWELAAARRISTNNLLIYVACLHLASAPVCIKKYVQ